VLSINVKTENTHAAALPTEHALLQAIRVSECPALPGDAADFELQTATLYHQFAALRDCCMT
jgi:hypothetical protein